MEITATQTFLDGESRYEEGETYDVPEHKAGYFVGNGWATSPDIESPQDVRREPVTLEPQDSKHATRSKTREG